MNDRIRKVIKERSGPSFEERVAVSSARFAISTREKEAEQKQILEAAVARARARPCDSPVRAKELYPPTIEDCGKEHAHTRRQNEARYKRESTERKLRMTNREPLFKLSEVAAAFDMQDQRMKDNKRRMKEDEDRRWDHLQELQVRVIERPLLLEAAVAVESNTPAPPPLLAEGDVIPEAEPKDQNWRAKFQGKLQHHIKQTIKERSGPSFEERIAIRSAKFRKEAKETEVQQLKVIEDAVAKAWTHPCESPFREKELEPRSIESWYKEHAETRLEMETRYAELAAESQARRDAREPLFKVSEVEAVFEMQRQRQLANQKRLRDDEAKNWAELQNMQHEVIDRPLLVENYERTVHTKKEIEPRLIPNHTKRPQMEQNILKAVSCPDFKDSAWGKELDSLRSRLDVRPKLHEIAYPPKVFKEKPCRPRTETDLDKRVRTCISQPWFSQTQWSTQVQEIAQRMNDRPKLHEITYPVRTPKFVAPKR